jgi:Glu-tRNA(Gln) amidotransferase subunit E-like FAD-binding protein
MTTEKKYAELATLNTNVTKEAQEALRARARIQTLKTTNSELTTKNAVLEGKLSGANDRLNSANISQSSINELHNMLTIQKNVSAGLVVENDRLKEAQANNAQMLKSREEETAFYKAKLSNVEYDLEEALASAWQDRDRYVSKHPPSRLLL